MPCKPGVAGSIPSFSIKPLSVEPSGVPVIKPTQILNQPGGTGLYTQESHKKNVVCPTSKGSDQPAHMRSLIRAFC